jgi:hypothetical protein
MRGSTPCRSECLGCGKLRYGVLAVIRPAAAAHVLVTASMHALH